MAAWRMKPTHMVCMLRAPIAGSTVDDLRRCMIFLDRGSVLQVPHGAASRHVLSSSTVASSFVGPAGRCLL